MKAMGSKIFHSHAFVLVLSVFLSAAFGQLTTQASRTTVTGMPVGGTTRTGTPTPSASTQASSTTRPTPSASTQASSTTRPTPSASTQASSTTRPTPNASTQASATTTPTSTSNASTQASATTRPTLTSNASTQASATTRPTLTSNVSTQASATTIPTLTSNASTQASATTRPTSMSNASTQASATTIPTLTSSASTQASATTRPTSMSNASTQASAITNSTPSSNASTQASATTRPTPTMVTRNVTTNATTGTLGLTYNPTTKPYVPEISVSTQSTTVNLIPIGNTSKTETPSNVDAQESTITEPTPNTETKDTTTEATTDARTSGITDNPTTRTDLSETSELPSTASSQASANTEPTPNTEVKDTTTEATTEARTLGITDNPNTSADFSEVSEDLGTTDNPITTDLSEISEIVSNAYAQALTMTEPTPNMENKPVTTEATIDAGALGITNNPTTNAILPESSDSGNVSEDEIRVFTKIANKIIQKKLETIEEKIDKVVEKINGEEQRYSKKLTNVAFFAQRNSSFDQKNTIQPYLINRLNDGKAFNQASGIFTVPINGNYHFYFTALKASAEISGTSIITVRLWANRNQKEKSAQMLAEGHVNSNDMHGWFPVILQATVKLQENDTVEVELLVGSIHESENLEHLMTSFGGFLVSPEIV
ncbi:mucin-5AC isoform X2 [Daphnia magna]|uniref:mucin-5AC isoform X2 n=1 Tax=Daphnia magna TaxID=35525 RepID=UPI001E1BDA52|nr:mucin-5AC isoform X2 [Daphnia magna]